MSHIQHLCNRYLDNARNIYESIPDKEDHIAYYMKNKIDKGNEIVSKGESFIYLFQEFKLLQKIKEEYPKRGILRNKLNSFNEEELFQYISEHTGLLIMDVKFALDEITMLFDRMSNHSFTVYKIITIDNYFDRILDTYKFDIYDKIKNLFCCE
jgi:hypothetical protein